MPFEIVSQTEYLLVKLRGDCLGDEKPSLLESFQSLIGSSGLKKAVIQCSECAMVGLPFMRQMSQVYRELKSVNGELRLVAANEFIQNTIRTNGLDRILVNRLSLRGALVDLGLAKAKDFDVNFINPFLNATQKVFKVQCFLETRPQKPYLKKPTDPMLLGDISGIIAVTSETFSGTLAISLSEKIFAKIATNMLGEACEKIEESNVDLIGEIANIILGQAKIELGQLGYNVQMALPSCVWGKDHKIKHFGGGVCVVIPFETDHGTIYSEVMTQTTGSGQKAA